MRDAEQIEVAMAEVIRSQIAELNSIANQLLLAPYAAVESQLITVMNKLEDVRAAGECLKNGNTDAASFCLFDSHLPVVEVESECERTARETA